MKSRHARLATFLGLILAGPCARAELDYTMVSPAFRVSIPHFPAMEIKPHPHADRNEYLRVIGAEKAYTVSVTAGKSPGRSPAECAAAIVSALADRPSVPKDPKSIVKFRVDKQRTYIAIYPARTNGLPMVHAHLMSAADEHCIEVHASQVIKDPSEFDPFLEGFRNAWIRPR